MWEKKLETSTDLQSLVSRGTTPWNTDVDLIRISFTMIYLIIEFSLHCVSVIIDCLYPLLTNEFYGGVCPFAYPRCAWIFMIVFTHFTRCCSGGMFIGSSGERTGEVSSGHYGCQQEEDLGEV